MERPEENDMISRHPELWDEPDHIRNELARTMGHIYSHGMTTTSGGNMSVTDSHGNIWISPSGTDKGSLQPGEVVCVASDGSFAGPLKPSMEYPLHRAIYNARPDIRALIHAHPPLLTSFSIVRKIPDTSVIREWREVCRTVGYAGYATPGSREMGENVAAEFSKGHDAVIMENHAVVAGGKNLAEALARLETLEYCARTIHTASVIGEVSIPDYAQENNPELPAVSRLPSWGHGSHDRETGCVLIPEEERLAEEICRMTARACNRGLMYGFCGYLSARSAVNSFLMTREGVLRSRTGKKDICTVKCRESHSDNEPAEETGRAGGNGQADAGTMTGAARTGLNTWLHAEIYSRCFAVNAVITAQPPYLMAFAVTGREIDVRTIPESWLLLKELPSLPADALTPGREDIFEKLRSGSPAVLLGHSLVIVTGDNLLQAFDRLEVAEMTAMSLALAKQSGEVKSIPDEQIEALKSTFLK